MSRTTKTSTFGIDLFARGLERDGQFAGRLLDRRSPSSTRQITAPIASTRSTLLQVSEVDLAGFGPLLPAYELIGGDLGQACDAVIGALPSR